MITLKLPKIDSIPLILKLPQVGSFNIEFDIIDNRLILDNKYQNCWLDFVITVQEEFKIGKGHYKLSLKAQEIKMAGELMVNSEGLVVGINNNSGHYQPSIHTFRVFVEALSQQCLLLDSTVKIEIINWMDPNLLSD